MIRLKCESTGPVSTNPGCQPPVQLLWLCSNASYFQLIVSCPGPGVRRSRCFASYFQRNETLAVSRPTCCFLQHINIVNWNSSDIQISNNTLSVSWNLHKVRSSAFSSSICSDMSSNRWAHLQKSQKKCLWRELKPYKTMKKNVNNCPERPTTMGPPTDDSFITP